MHSSDQCAYSADGGPHGADRGADFAYVPPYGLSNSVPDCRAGIANRCSNPTYFGTNCAFGSTDC